MMTPDERARLERLEQIVAQITNSSGIEPLSGDVNGASNNNALTQIQALAGGGNQIVGVDNTGAIQVAVIPPPGPQPMGGDVTGTTAASVISKIASLAGAGSRFVTIDNAGVIGALVNVPLAGDVTGNSGASVISKIAALAGGGVQFVAVDNAGNIGTAVPPTPPFAMGGDVAGTTTASTVVKINGATVTVAGAVGNVLQVTGANALGYAPVNLAGGANFVTGLLPEANQADQTMLGDVTGTTGASVISKIAALAGGGTLLVAVNNAGNIVSGGAPPTGLPTFLSQTATAIHAAFTNVDFDLSAFLDNAMVIEVRCIGASKEGTAHLADAFYAAGQATVDNKNGTLNFGSASLGLPTAAANPHNTADSHVPVYAAVTTDGNLRSGGGSPILIDCQLPGGGAIFRVRINSSAPAQDCPVTVFLTIYSKLAS